MQEIRCDDGEVIIKDGDEEAEFFYVVERWETIYL